MLMPGIPPYPAVLSRCRIWYSGSGFFVPAALRICTANCTTLLQWRYVVNGGMSSSRLFETRCYQSPSLGLDARRHR